MADAPKINGTDTLRDAYPKLNSAIDNSNEALTKAIDADGKANEAKTTAETVQTQFDQVVAEAGSNNPEVVQARGEAVNLNARLDATDSQLAESTKQEQDALRAKYPKRFAKYPFPTGWTWTDAPINIYTDGVKFSTDFDVSKFKNVSTNTYYVNPVTGLDTNDGLTENTALQRISTALGKTIEGDTIILLDGVYTRQLGLNSTTITKSVNIIAKNKGKALVSLHDFLAYQKLEGKNYVYYATRSNVNKVVNVSGIDNDVTFTYTKVNSIDECEALAGSWYTDNVTLYVHDLENGYPDNNKVFALLLSNGLTANSTTNNLSIYLEGLKLIGGQNGSVMIQNTVSFTQPNFYAKNCDFLYSALLNAVQIEGAKYAFLQNCKAMYAESDGFNYHAKNGQIVKSIEVNCIGGNNGNNVSTFDINNGSTTHDGCKAIRINCTYFNNKGTNVADVNAGTQSLNLGVVAYDSDSSTTDRFRCNFSAQQTGAELWLENCVTFGSLNDIESVTGGTVHIKNTKYSTIIGGGVFDLQ